MYRYDHYDHALVAERVAQFRDQTARFISGALTEDEFLLDYSKNRITAETLDLLLALGRHAARALLATEASLQKLRGRIHQRPGTTQSVLVTFHPAYLLRSPSYKRMTWQDLRAIAKQLEQVTSS